jgi:hypothetical protein
MYQGGRTSKFRTHGAFFPSPTRSWHPFKHAKKLLPAATHLPLPRCSGAVRHRPPPTHQPSPAHRPRWAARRRLRRTSFTPPPVVPPLPRPSRVGTGTVVGPSPPPDAGLSTPPPGVEPPTTDTSPQSTVVGHRSHQSFFQVFFEFILNVIKFRWNLRFNLSEID